MHSTSSVQRLQCILMNTSVLQRNQSYLLMPGYLCEAGFSKKKKKNLREAGLVLKLLQTPRYCTDRMFKYNALDRIPRDMKKHEPRPGG